MTNDTKSQLEGRGIDYADAMERFGGNEALYRRLAAKFPSDPHFAEMKEALDDHDFDAALRAAHALKGVAGNLSFAALYQAACDMNDALRAGDTEAARNLLPRVESAYDNVLEALKLLEG